MSIDTEFLASVEVKEDDLHGNCLTAVAQIPTGKTIGVIDKVGDKALIRWHRIPGGLGHELST